MITGSHLRAARGFLGIGQKTPGERSGLSVPTIQRMDASAGPVCGVIDSPTKVVAALDLAGVESNTEALSDTANGHALRLKSSPAAQ